MGINWFVLAEPLDEVAWGIEGVTLRNVFLDPGQNGFWV
jgi:hypothetical protein